MSVAKLVKTGGKYLLKNSSGLRSAMKLKEAYGKLDSVLYSNAGQYRKRLGTVFDEIIGLGGNPYERAVTSFEGVQNLSKRQQNMLGVIREKQNNFESMSPELEAIWAKHNGNLGGKEFDQLNYSKDGSKYKFKNKISKENINEAKSKAKSKIEDNNKSEFFDRLSSTWNKNGEEYFKKYGNSEAKGPSTFDYVMGNKIPQKAAGAGMAFWLVNTLSNNKGRQTNAQLYGQDDSYIGY